MLVDVNCDDGTVQIARIVKDEDDTCTVRFLERIKSNLYEFTTDDVVEKSSISAYDTDDLERHYRGKSITVTNSSTTVRTRISHVPSLIRFESEDDVSLVDEDETKLVKKMTFIYHNGL